VELLPKSCFLTRGVGRHREKLASFEEALRRAAIANFNLVTVSSIFPPGCLIEHRESGMGKLKTGQIVFCVMSRAETDEPGRRVAVSVGIAIPKDCTHHGYISEHHAFGQDEKQAGDYAEDLAAGMLASTLGVEFDLDKAYDERKEQYLVGGQIVDTRNWTQTALGEDGLWTTVLSAVVFLI